MDLLFIPLWKTFEGAVINSNSIRFFVHFNKQVLMLLFILCVIKNYNLVLVNSPGSVNGSLATHHWPPNA